MVDIAAVQLSKTNSSHSLAFMYIPDTTTTTTTTITSTTTTTITTTNTTT